MPTFSRPGGPIDFSPGREPWVEGPSPIPPGRNPPLPAGERVGVWGPFVHPRLAPWAKVFRPLRGLALCGVFAAVCLLPPGFCFRRPGGPKDSELVAPTDVPAVCGPCPCSIKQPRTSRPGDRATPFSGAASAEQGNQQAWGDRVKYILSKNNKSLSLREIADPVKQTPVPALMLTARGPRREINAALVRNIIRLDLKVN
jgi:hypothetical protein